MPSRVDPDFPLPPEHFVGRRDLIQAVCDRLRQRELLSSQVVGGPRTGKTSLLRFLASPHAGPHLTGAERCVRVYVDAAGLGHQATPQTFWLKVFRELDSTLTATGADATLRDAVVKAHDRAAAAQLDLFDLEDVFDEFGHRSQPVVVLADEIDSIVASPTFLPPSDFFNQVRSLGQRTPRGLAFVVTTMRPLGDLVGAAVGPSPFYNHFGSVALGALGPDDLRDLIRERLGDAAGLPPVETLVEYSGGHPYLVSQLLAIWDAARPLGDAVAALLTDPEGPFVRLSEQILGVLSPHERQLVATALDTPDVLSEGQRATLAKLRKYSLLPPALLEAEP